MYKEELLVEKMQSERWSSVGLANELGITPQAFRFKLRGETEFKASEIVKLSELLRLTDRETRDIFLAKK